MKSIRILQSSENSKIYKTRRWKRGGGEKCVLKNVPYYSESSQNRKIWKIHLKNRSILQHMAEYWDLSVSQINVRDVNNTITQHDSINNQNIDQMGRRLPIVIFPIIWFDFLTFRPINAGCYPDCLPGMGLNLSQLQVYGTFSPSPLPLSRCLSLFSVWNKLHESFKFFLTPPCKSLSCRFQRGRGGEGKREGAEYAFCAQANFKLYFSCSLSCTSLFFLSLSLSLSFFLTLFLKSSLEAILELWATKCRAADEFDARSSTRKEMIKLRNKKQYDILWILNETSHAASYLNLWWRISGCELLTVK